MNRKLLQQALNALEYHTQQTRPIHNTELAIDALRSALAAPMPEPVAWLADDGTIYADRGLDGCTTAGSTPIYAAPPAAPAEAQKPEPGHDCSQCRTPQACRSEQMCLSTLYRGQFPPAAPADMVMVPRKPTPEMIEAADQSDKEYSLRSFGPGTVVAQSGYDHWVAMIAAAPPAAPAVPLTIQQYNMIPELCAIKPSLYESIVRAIEKAHGIGGGNG